MLYYYSVINKLASILYMHCIYINLLYERFLGAACFCYYRQYKGISVYFAVYIHNFIINICTEFAKY